MKQALLVALSLSCVAPRVASAQNAAPTHDAHHTEAADRFDRGLRLFNAGDAAGALAEFRRAYELIPNVLVLYNIGLVYAQMGRAVDATDTLARVIEEPGTLSAERLAVARRTHDEQSARTAEMSLTSNVDGASVEVDGVEVTKLPLTKPLRVTSGTHVIGAIAAGFAPLRREVTIASGESQALKLDLIPMQGRLAHVEVKTHLYGAEVFADGEHVGTTPLPASFPLAPGPHTIELRRRAYVTARAEITLGDGASGEVRLEPDEDPTAVASAGGLLALRVDETEVVITVDGRARGVYAGPLRLAPGPHHLVVERGDFEPAERDVTIESGQTTTLPVTLDPTPEYRAHYVSRAYTQRTWGLVSVIAGAAIAAGGAALVVYDGKQRSDARSDLSALQAQSGLGQICDRGQDSSIYTQHCVIPTTTANGKIDDANLRDGFGWSAVGVGGAAVALGVVLVVTADDPRRYDHGPGGDARRARLVPTFWTSRGGAGASLTGAF